MGIVEVGGGPGGLNGGNFRFLEVGGGLSGDCFSRWVEG